MDDQMPDTLDEAHQMIRNLRLSLELVESREGFDMFAQLDRRLSAMTAALNGAARRERERRESYRPWMFWRSKPSPDAGYFEGMQNLMEALAHTALEALVANRWAVLEHERAEALRASVDFRDRAKAGLATTEARGEQP